MSPITPSRLLLRQVYKRNSGAQWPFRIATESCTASTITSRRLVDSSSVVSHPDQQLLPGRGSDLDRSCPTRNRIQLVTCGSSATPREARPPDQRGPPGGVADSRGGHPGHGRSPSSTHHRRTVFEAADHIQSRSVWWRQTARAHRHYAGDRWADRWSWSSRSPPYQP